MTRHHRPLPVLAADRFGEPAGDPENEPVLVSASTIAFSTMLATARSSRPGSTATIGWSGSEVPVLCHRCDSHTCTNPSPLRLGTTAENEPRCGRLPGPDNPAADRLRSPSTADRPYSSPSAEVASAASSSICPGPTRQQPPTSRAPDASQSRTLSGS